LIVGAVLVLLAGCFAPPPRDLERDEIMRVTTEETHPVTRVPVDANHGSEDIDLIDLDLEAARLASEFPLDRIQADNRLRAAGEAGVQAVARLLDDGTESVEALKEAIEFLTDIDISEFDLETRSSVRERLAWCLDHPVPLIRSNAARALQVQGPGTQRTRFLRAITDSERRVRWAVVRRFGDHPTELTQAQREYLINLLTARTPASFEAADLDKDARVTASEFRGLPDATDEEFKLLDRDGTGFLTLEQWTAGWPSGMRADVAELLRRMMNHPDMALTPAATPIGYNPYAPPLEQQAAIEAWRAWSARLAARE
jgi:hypothetical protein